MLAYHHRHPKLKNGAINQILGCDCQKFVVLCYTFGCLEFGLNRAASKDLTLEAVFLLKFRSAVHRIFPSNAKKDSPFVPTPCYCPFDYGTA